MPLYDCLCTKCGKSFEALTRSWTEQPSCPRCNYTAHKLPSAPAIRFGGDGWQTKRAVPGQD